MLQVVTSFNKILCDANAMKSIVECLLNSLFQKLAALQQHSKEWNEETLQDQERRLKINNPYVILNDELSIKRREPPQFSQNFSETKTVAAQDNHFRATNDDKSDEGATVRVDIENVEHREGNKFVSFGSMKRIGSILKKKESEIPRDHWVPDTQVKQCHVCGQIFSVINRKHHCRLCGQVICSSCSLTIRSCKICISGGTIAIESRNSHAVSEEHSVHDTVVNNDIESQQVLSNEIEQNEDFLIIPNPEFSLEFTGEMHIENDSIHTRFITLYSMQLLCIESCLFDSDIRKWRGPYYFPILDLIGQSVVRGNTVSLPFLFLLITFTFVLSFSLSLSITKKINSSVCEPITLGQKWEGKIKENFFFNSFHFVLLYR